MPFVALVKELKPLPLLVVFSCSYSPYSFSPYFLFLPSLFFIMLFVKSFLNHDAGECLFAYLYVELGAEFCVCGINQCHADTFPRGD